MLEITIPGEQELWDAGNERFIECKNNVVLRLEHSLLSLSKWEAKWHISFVDNDNLSVEQMLDYIYFMSLDSKIDPNVLLFLTEADINRIKDYIDNPMTATEFMSFGREKPGSKRNQSKITSELIYYWMIACQIPFSPCEKWHLNRLITLIRVCSEKNNPNKKKIPKRELASWYRNENERRKALMHTKG